MSEVKPSKHDLQRLVVASKLKSWFFNLLGFGNVIIGMYSVMSGVYTVWIILQAVTAVYSARIVSHAEMIAAGAMGMINNGEYDETSDSD